VAIVGDGASDGARLQARTAAEDRYGNPVFVTSHEGSVSLCVRPDPLPPSGPRLSLLLMAGAVDALGLALGWTVITFHILRSGGLTTVGVYNGLMFAGTVAAAPATSWLGRWMSLRRLLITCAGAEALSRAAVLALVFSGAPLAVTAPAILMMTVSGLTGYACMRACVDDLRSEPTKATRRLRRRRWQRPSSGITAYIVTVTICEALGGALASVLPGRPPGCSGALPVVVTMLYAGSLVPTILVAVSIPGRHTISSAHGPGPWTDRGLIALLGQAAFLTALCSGPTLLYVALTTQYLGAPWVALAAVVNAVGMALAPPVVGVLTRSRVPDGVVWSFLSAGVIAGWALVPMCPWALLGAQLVAGGSMAALEGHMDDAVARRDRRGAAQALAMTEATRSVGYGLATVLLPLLARTTSFQTAVNAALGGTVAYGAAQVILVWLRRSRPFAR
jgi:hypothetical protein